MAKNSAAELLTSVGELFTTQEERDNAQRSYVIDLPAAEISDFPDHPFKVRMDDSMMELADSVKQHGILVPSLVRPMPDGSYQMVSGHRRKRAAELAELPTVPCIVRELTDDEAIIIMVDSNLQREQVLPSEKAFAYKMKLDALKRQGQRTDLTSAPPGPKSRSNKELAEQSPDGVTQIKRYIRLTNLTPELLDMVDNSVLKEKDKLQMALRPAVELSYLSKDEQNALLEVMEGEDCTPSHAQAIKMREFSEKGKLNPDVILSIMQEEKPNQVEQFKIPRNRIDKFFPAGTPAQKIEDTIVKALEMYRTGAWIATISVVLFAACMLLSFNFGSYFVCMFLPIGYIMMSAGFCNESDEKHRVAAYVGLVFAAVYAVLIFLVYFAQTTSVRLDSFDEQAMGILDYSKGGLFFNYDLLGYGMMALSTFFIGLTITGRTKADKWLKYLMIIHGIFFLSCFIMPMTGVFGSMSNGETRIGGVVALEFWCAYFTPIGILSLIHFKRGGINSDLPDRKNQ